MTEQPDMTQHIKAHEDPFLHGEGEPWDEVFKGEQSFSREFYRAQAEDTAERKKCSAFCICHLNPHDYVPVCPTHFRPLIAAEAGNGFCTWTAPRVRNHVGGQEFTSGRCIAWGPGSWEWKPRRMFNQSDLPPFNGWQPPKTPPWMEPRTWGFETHDCPTCGETTHTVGDDRLVCLGCGLCRWTKDLTT